MSEFLYVVSGAMLIVDCDETPIARTVSVSPRESQEWADRITASVNAWAGIPTEMLAPARAAGRAAAL